MRAKAQLQIEVPTARDRSAVESEEPFELLRRCRGGDTSAAKQLYLAHFRLVCGLARRLGTPEHEVEDVCQDVFAIAFRRLADYRDGPFSAWLRGITVKVATARWRRRRTRELFASVLQGRTPQPIAPEARHDARAALELVQRLLERLPPKKREAFWLHEIEGRSLAEIAELVGCPLDTAGSRVREARREFLRRAAKAGLA